MSPGSRPRTGTLALLLSGVVLGLVAAELALRAWWSGPALVWDPGERVFLDPDPRHVSGVRGPAHFVVSEAGLRGDPIPPEPAYHVLALGGSTTECAALDTGEAWPALVQEQLGRALGAPVWVGNGGRSGASLRHHRTQAEVLLEQLPRIDAVLVLAGGNDLLRGVAREAPEPWWHDDPRERVRVHYQSFEVPSRPGHGPLHERTEVVRLLRLTKQRLARLASRDVEADFRDGRQYAVARALRGRSPRRDQLPPLDSALAGYRRDLDAMVALAEAQGVRLMLATQPVLWRADLDERLEALLWLGTAGPAPDPERPSYFSAAALAEGMERFNAELLAACREHGIPCLDLAALLPADTTVFYDDLHFNERGSRAVAREMTAFLAEALGEWGAARGALSPASRRRATGNLPLADPVRPGI